jgi:cell wall-associated NlpC family hydrolase
MKINIIVKSILCTILLIFIGICAVPNLCCSVEKVNYASSAQQNDKHFEYSNITVPDCVEIGDLMLLDIRLDESNQWKIPGPYNEHSAIYIGNNTLFTSGIISNGVCAYDYSVYYQDQKNFVFLRVKTANESQRHSAAAWAISQNGKPYQYFFRPPGFGLKIANTHLPLPTANKFYCMELVWAAYYNQGIDIDQNEWRFPWWVSGDDILQDTDIEIIYKNVMNSTEITKPLKGIYIANKKIVSTLEKTIILGDITIEAVTYNENVTHMDFYIDNVYKATETSKPYMWTWNEKTAGRKVIKTIAYDDKGDQYSTVITVWKIF